jgi:hypothetical protein
MAVMRFITAILFALIVLTATGLAWAGQAEVRDVAIANNCPPKKIEVYKQSLGADGDTVYQVQCVLPKTVGAAADNGTTPPDALLIDCKQNLCDLLRPVTLEKK